MSAPFPWLDATWQTLVQAHRTDKLGHAYLICGREGLGKVDFATAFAGLLLCETPTEGEACGGCRGCLLYDAGNHPDFKMLGLEEDRTRIVIDQVRELIDYFALKSHYRSRKLALVHPAELMNHNAANALLKILEEPPEGALLMLVSHRPGQLAQTISSRCQRLNLRDPDWATCIDWLEAQGADQQTSRAASTQTLSGAPLDIREQLSSAAGPPFNPLIETLTAIANGQTSVLRAAAIHTDFDIRRLIDALDLIIRAVVVLGAGHRPLHLRLPASHERHLQEISNKLNSKRLFFFLDQIASARAVVLRSSGVRGAEIIENLFYCWAKVTQPETRV